ncbi:hypothetical protein SeLEV6574_g08117 [Synchytrium endobioticum]|uniref:Uncharacterized protein n=1 Tax=Synchytrium endobioticum TaxID=286115 RepID=A0A507C3H0_9FUNG|nr:hypothetical protein SeLEV6574_g08117 [Synchytrium endobioticum]
MANFLTKAVQHRFHDEKQWRNYGSITIFNRPHGTSHVAIKYRNEELPVSLLVLPSPPSSTDVTTAPTLPGAERSSAPLSRSKFECHSWSGETNYDEFLGSFEIACRMAGLTGDDMLNTFYSKLPEGTRFRAKNRYDMAGNEIPTTSYQTATELYRESISDPTLAGGLKNTSKILATLKLRANESVQGPRCCTQCRCPVQKQPMAASYVLGYTLRVYPVVLGHVRGCSSMG